jgi:hypothetical protein
VEANTKTSLSPFLVLKKAMKKRFGPRRLRLKFTAIAISTFAFVIVVYWDNE